MNKYQKFWEWFEQNEQSIHEDIESEMDKWVPLISEKLYEIDDNLAFEISEVLEDGKRQFIISADGIYLAFDNVIEIYKSRPQLNKWEFIAFRQREDIDEHQVELDGLVLGYDDIKFKYEVEEELLKIDVYIKEYTVDDNRYVHAYFLLLDSLIGEFDAVTMILETNVYPFDTNEELHNFFELKKIVDELK